MIKSDPEIARSKIVIIASQRDAAIQDCANVITQAGGVIEWVSNVYAAMATLAKGVPVSCVVIDTRFLDETEGAFLSLAPRYFQGVDFVVPELHINGRGAEARTDGVRRLPVNRLKECVPPIETFQPPTAPQEPAAPAQAPSWSEFPLDVELTSAHKPIKPDEVVPPAITALSTDSGSQLDEDGLSLHEAVRKRMGADDPRMVRRRPPSARPPEQNDNRNRPPANPASVSDEELRALLDPRQFGGKSPDSPSRETP
jgi:hypothetical protein